MSKTSRPNDPHFYLYQGDAIEWLRTLKDRSVNLVITDPPYESLEKHRAHGTTTRLKKSKASSNEWFEVFPNSRFPELFTELWRVLARNSHLYLFCDCETMFIVKPLAEAAGFRFWKALVWDKMKIGMGYHYRCQHELILFFEKGKRKLNDLGVSDVIRVPRIRNGRPAEKPEAVSDVLVRQSSMPGDIVADPFMGAGTVGASAIKLGRHFWGSDISEAAYKTTMARLDSARSLPHRNPSKKVKEPARKNATPGRRTSQVLHAAD